LNKSCKGQTKHLGDFCFFKVASDLCAHFCVQKTRFDEKLNEMYCWFYCIYASYSVHFKMQLAARFYEIK